jgi:hypothetical protein
MLAIAQGYQGLVLALEGIRQFLGITSQKRL